MQTKVLPFRLGVVSRVVGSRYRKVSGRSSKSVSSRSAVRNPAAVFVPQKADSSRDRNLQSRRLRLVSKPAAQVRRRQIKECGKQGFQKTSTIQHTTDPAHGSQWEESWWEASDWNGFRELGAKKSCIESNRSWTEEWMEKLYFDSLLKCHVIHKTCKKWCKVTDAEEEWQEEWEEKFVKNGLNKRWCKKWGHNGSLVWHENWGDGINSEGNGNLWTDKWYEDIIEDEGKVSWGEKWEAQLEDKYEISRSGETWRKSTTDYTRWWKEEKSKPDLKIRRTGNSTSGEYWDEIESLSEDAFLPVVETNRYELAVVSSPQLLSIELTPVD